jgi:peptidoglycan/LPS O-acetylase OafA/YrhL
VNRGARLLFYGYVLLLVVAGLWGAVFAGRDVRLISGFDPSRLPVEQSAALLSQYRFLRAIELGFGIFALVYRKEVFGVRAVNLAFLTVMGLGIAARVLGFVLDGTPSAPMVFFAAYETVAIIVIFLATRSARSRPSERPHSTPVR